MQNSLFRTGKLPKNEITAADFYVGTTPNVQPGNPVPEPATMLLLGSGLIGLVGYGRRKFFKK